MQDTATRHKATCARSPRDHAALGLILGALFGVAFIVALGASGARAGAERVATAGKPVLDATHLPPLLTSAGEDVALRYDAHCASSAEQSTEAGCATPGTVFLRTGTSGSFRAIPLAVDVAAVEGRQVARVPSAIARSTRGFSYYAVFTADTGETITLPAGGADAPHRSLPLGRPVTVSLGRHVFGRTREAHARVAAAGWGNGVANVGLEGGVNVPPVGGSSFDVDDAGNVFLLDQVHKRVLRYSKVGEAPSVVPVSIEGTIADLAVAEDRAMYVLEAAHGGRLPAVRTFAGDGHALSVVELAERTASQVRAGAGVPVVLQQPSGQWVPVAKGDEALSAAAQTRAGRSGRPLADGRELIVLRTGNELRIAVVEQEVVRRSWRITSESALAEVQLAEPLADGLLVVVRVYSDTEDEFVALFLGPRGLRSAMSLESVDWAESAPLSRFRLAGSSLYQLGSTPSGVFVNRFDLEVR